MAEFLGCGLHGQVSVQRVMGYEDEGWTVVLACGHKHDINTLQVPIFEAPDDSDAQAQTAPVPVQAAAAAAETLPSEATWTEVVKLAEANLAAAEAEPHQDA